jgi:hypothetical protein
MRLAAGVGKTELLTFGAAGFAGVTFPKPLLAFAAIATVRRPATPLCRSIAPTSSVLCAVDSLGSDARRCAGNDVPLQ